MADGATPHLAITDADSIHEYVFSPHELRLIRGGSRLQRDINEEAGRMAGAGAIVSGGGRVIAAFPNSTAASEFCSRVEALYRGRTAIATVTTAIGPCDSMDFQKSLEDLEDRLERNKQARAGARFFGGSPFWVNCGSCGEHPASRLGQDEPVCEACYLRDAHGHHEAGEAKDFETIGAAAHPENYLAIVYIDVDRLGRYLSDHGGSSPHDYHRLSGHVQAAVEAGVKSGLRGIRQKARLLVGGDDAIVAVPADKAAGFLKRFAETFRAADFSPAPSRPTFSAGLVMAHSHYPIAEFIRIAEELQKSAKSVKGADAVDYEVVSTSMAGRVTKQREQGEGLARTGRPYALDNFFDLATGIRNLKKNGAPQSQVNSLYRIAHGAAMQSELEYLNVLSRTARPVRQELVRTIGSRLWQQDQGRVWTRAADLVELWEFIDGTEADD